VWNLFNDLLYNNFGGHEQDVGECKSEKNGKNHEGEGGNDAFNFYVGCRFGGPNGWLMWVDFFTVFVVRISGGGGLDSRGFHLIFNINGKVL
jgi:hypothetical protein